MAREPQAGGTDLEKSWTEGSPEAAKTAETMVERWVVHPLASRACEPRVEL